MKNYPYKHKSYYEVEDNTQLYLSIIIAVFVVLNVINS